MIGSHPAGLVVTLFLWLPIGAKVLAQSGENRIADKKVGPAVTSCPVTLPPKPATHHDAMSYFEPGTSRWKPALSPGPFGLWPEGTIVFRPGGPGSVEPDGSLAM